MAGQLTFWFVWLRGNQKQTPPPPSPFTKGQIFDPICFCYSVLGSHSFEFNFYGIYDELFWPQRAPELFQLWSYCISLLFDWLCVITFVCLACADRQFSHAGPVWDVTNRFMVLVYPILRIAAARKKSSLSLNFRNFWAHFFPCVGTGNTHIKCKSFSLLAFPWTLNQSQPIALILNNTFPVFCPLKPGENYCTSLMNLHWWPMCHSDTPYCLLVKHYLI